MTSQVRIRQYCRVPHVPRFLTVDALVIVSWAVCVVQFGLKSMRQSIPSYMMVNCSRSEAGHDSRCYCGVLVELAVMAAGIVESDA